jgi:hypothetical protein
MPRPHKTKEEIRAVRRKAANARWSGLSEADRRAAMKPAVAASPRTKPGNSGGGGKKKSQKISSKPKAPDYKQRQGNDIREINYVDGDWD